MSFDLDTDLEIWRNEQWRIPFVRHEVELERAALDRADLYRYTEQHTLATNKFGNAHIDNEIKYVVRNHDRVRRPVLSWQLPVRLSPEEQQARDSYESDNVHRKQEVADENERDETHRGRGRVWITLDEHWLYPHYTHTGIPEKFDTISRLPDDDEGIDRNTLMVCSGLAKDYFTWHPEKLHLHLPVTYPRKHADGSTQCVEWHYPLVDGKKYTIRQDEAFGHVAREPIIQHLIPWFTAVEKAKQSLETNRDPKKIPRPEIPDSLLEKIHLYAAMLHLEVPRFIQRPLIEALTQQLYRTPLRNCHLTVIERCIARFHSQSTQVLDPVLCLFFGTYAHRTPEDRNHPSLIPPPPPYPPDQPTADADTDTIPEHELLNYDSDYEFDRYINLAHELQRHRANNSNLSANAADATFPGTRNRLRLARSNIFHVRKDPRNHQHRTYLEYRTKDPRRTGFPDSSIVPPILPILAHGVRHWSGMGKRADARAAHTGYPLWIGRHKYYRREFDIVPRARDEDDQLRNQDQNQNQNAPPALQTVDTTIGPILAREGDRDIFWEHTTDNVRYRTRGIRLHASYDVLKPCLMIKEGPGLG